MAIRKELTKDNELYLYMNGNLIYKKWLNTGASKIFDLMAYDKYTLTSIRDLEIEKPTEKIIIKAKLKLKSTQENGRKTPIKSGYSPNHVFEYKNGILETFIGKIIFDDVNEIYPGEESIVAIEFLQNAPIERYLQKGQKWYIHEGLNQLGEAIMIQ